MKKTQNYSFLLIIVIIAVVHARSAFKKTPLDGQSITYGSLVKFYHPQTNFMLHSHGVKFGMNGVYSLTGYHIDDLGSYFQIREKHNSRQKTYSDHLQCGGIASIASTIMDYYLRTQEGQFGLTSQLNQFVHGQTKQGSIDARINWNIECENKQQGEDVKFGDMIRIKHANTGKYLSFSRQFFYHERNCGRGCVIAGQLQPHAIEEATDDRTIFQIVAGMTLQNEEVIAQQ